MAAKVVGAFLGLAFAMALMACGGGGDDAAGKLRVVASTTQIGDFAANVGGDHISLTVLLKPNQDAHDFQPKPSQVTALDRADVILRNGIGLDTYVVKATANDAKITVVTQGISLRDFSGEAEGDSDAIGEAAGHDPHVWFAAANAQRMVESIRDAFIAADPANADSYRQNAAAYTARLTTLDSELKSSVASLPQACRNLVTNHDFLGYYAAAYGFTIAGSVIPSSSTQAQASASDVAQIVQRIKAERVPAVFAETSVNPALIRQVGREAGVKVVDDLYSDSLGPKGSAGATYEGMMRENTRKIVEALSGCSG